MLLPLSPVWVNPWALWSDTFLMAVERLLTESSVSIRPVILIKQAISDLDDADECTYLSPSKGPLLSLLLLHR